MESAILRIYEAFEDTLGREKARTFAENLADLIQKKNNDLVTRENLSETELRLKKEIEEIKINAKDVELRLTKEINHAKIWTITAIGLIIGVLKGLDYLLK